MINNLKIFSDQQFFTDVKKPVNNQGRWLGHTAIGTYLWYVMVIRDTLNEALVAWEISSIVMAYQNLLIHQSTVFTELLCARQSGR